MIDSLDSPNLTLRLTDTAGAALAAADALDRSAALRYELRESGVPVSVTPTVCPTVLGADISDVAAAELGAVALAVLPPMLPALLDVLRGWIQRNPGIHIMVHVVGDAPAAEHDPLALDARDEAALVAALQQHLDACWGDETSSAA